jgi:hypothetical protein
MKKDIEELKEGIKESVDSRMKTAEDNMKMLSGQLNQMNDTINQLNQKRQECMFMIAKNQGMYEALRLVKQDQDEKIIPEVP